MVFETRGEKIFKVFNYIFLTLFTLLELYPVVYVLAASLSSPAAVLGGEVSLFPIDLTFDSYAILLKDKAIYIAYLNTIFYTVVGTAVSIVVQVLIAYPLSKKRLHGRSFVSLMIAFTMWFSAGTIPLYLTFRDYGMLNTRAAIIFGFACGAYNFILLRTYFAGIPQAIEEAARIDGASDLYTLIRIVLPLSLPSLATIGLFYAVSRWNGYLWTMILLTDDKKIPLQVVLKKLVVDMTGHAENMNYDKDVAQNLSEETVMYATMVFAIVPMMALYPFIQKYFVKGIMLGSVKG